MGLGLFNLVSEIGLAYLRKVEVGWAFFARRLDAAFLCFLFRFVGHCGMQLVMCFLGKNVVRVGLLEFHSLIHSSSYLIIS
jgi:hypothetical protein